MRINERQAEENYVVNAFYRVYFICKLELKPLVMYIGRYESLLNLVGSHLGFQFASGTWIVNRKTSGSRAGMGRISYRTNMKIEEVLAHPDTS